jgi:hypothetical protein
MRTDGSTDWTDGQTDMTKLIVALRNFANALKNKVHVSPSCVCVCVCMCVFLI